MKSLSSWVSTIDSCWNMHHQLLRYSKGCLCAETFANSAMCGFPNSAARGADNVEGETGGGGGGSYSSLMLFTLYQNCWSACGYTCLTPTFEQYAEAGPEPIDWQNMPMCQICQNGEYFHPLHYFMPPRNSLNAYATINHCNFIRCHNTFCCSIPIWLIPILVSIWWPPLPPSLPRLSPAIHSPSCHPW